MDFATGDQGDLIDFARYHNVDIPMLTRRTKNMEGAHSTFRKPARDWIEGVGPAASWFERRGLDNKELLESLPIGRKRPEVVYEHKEDDKLVFGVYKNTSKKNSTMSTDA